MSWNISIELFYTSYFSDFGRYASQTEQSMDDVIGTNDRVQTQQKTTTIPPLMSLTITPPPIVTTSVQSNPTMSTSVIKEKYDFIF